MCIFWHKYTEWVEGEDCSTLWLKRYCKKCGKIQLETKKVSNHKFTPWIYGSYCIEKLYAGYVYNEQFYRVRKKKCTVCNEVVIERLEKITQGLAANLGDIEAK